MKLNKKHNIPYLSIWKHKDGGLYKALKVMQASPNGSDKIALFICLLFPIMKDLFLVADKLDRRRMK